MARVIGYNEKIFKKCTCHQCGAIIEYAPFEIDVAKNGDGSPRTEEGTTIMGLNCPNCRNFIRTNP